MNNRRYREIEIEGKQLLPSELREGWHYCSEFDDMLVGPTMPEWDVCMCWPKKRIESKRINDMGVEIRVGMILRDNEASHGEGVRLHECIGFDDEGRALLKRLDRRHNEQMVRNRQINAIHDHPSTWGFTIV